MANNNEINQDVELEIEEKANAEVINATKNLNSSIKKELSAEEKAKLSEKTGKHLRNVIANEFVKSLKDKSLPAFGKADKQGNIEFVPSSIRSYISGRSYSGIAQFVMQKYAKEMNFSSAEDGQTYVLTRKQAGFRNLKKDAKSIPAVSTSKDASGNYTTNYYYLYDANSLIDKSKTALKVPASTVRKPVNKNVVIDATKAETLEEYLGYYNAACDIGATFRTNSNVVNKVSQEGYKQLASSIEKGQDGKVFSLNSSIRANVSRAYEDLKNRRMAQNQERSNQQNVEMSYS